MEVVDRHNGLHGLQIRKYMHSNINNGIKQHLSAAEMLQHCITRAAEVELQRDVKAWEEAQKKEANPVGDPDKDPEKKPDRKEGD